MNEKLKKLRAQLVTNQDPAILVDRYTLDELLAFVEAVSAPNMKIAMQRFQEHIDRQNTRLQNQVDSINRLLDLVNAGKKK